jgi:hypothetical protein
VAIRPRMLIAGFVLRWKLERSTRDAEGITAISRWSSEANTTGSQPPSGRTPAGVPHLFKLEVQSVGVGLPERRGQAYTANSSRLGKQCPAEDPVIAPAVPQSGCHETGQFHCWPIFAEMEPQRRD